MNEEEIIDKVMMIDQWKVSGDIYTQNELNAIGELLDLYNKEKEKNKLLIEGKFREVADKNSYIKDNYINKEKIREKIEKLKKEGDYRDIYNPTGRVHFMKEETDYKIEILQELLEEE